MPRWRPGMTTPQAAVALLLAVLAWTVIVAVVIGLSYLVGLVLDQAGLGRVFPHVP